MQVCSGFFKNYARKDLEFFQTLKKIKPRLHIQMPVFHQTIIQNLANRQQRFEKFVLSFNRRLLKQQIITTRRSIKNRKIILSRNTQATQLAIKKYNSRKLILQVQKS